MQRLEVTAGGLPAPVIAVPSDVLSASFEIPRFDPALGYVTSASILFAGQVQGDVWLGAVNPSLPTQPLGLAQLLSYTVFSAGANAPGFETTPLTIQASDQGQIPSAGFIYLTLFADNQTALVPMTDLARGVGSGSFTINASWSGLFEAFPTGGQTDGGGRLFFAAEVRWSYLAFDDALRGTAAGERLDALTTGSIVYGEAGKDVLGGSAVQDVLFGGTGNDTLWGRGGHDTLSGDAGNDRLVAGAGDDVVQGGDGNDRLIGGAGHDRLEGGKGRDRLEGGNGNDTLLGGAGNDTLLAGTGSDVLTGGAGADVFVWTNARQSTNTAARDRITDFESGIDRIDISGLGTGLSFAAGFSNVAGQVVYDQARGQLLVDLGGDGSADFSVALRAGTLLVAADLML